MNAKANLLKYIEKKSISKSEFYKKTGLSNGFLDKNVNISSNNLKIIISVFEDLSLDWLITGQGNMLRNDCTPTPTAQECLLCQEKDKLIQALQTTVDTQATLISYLQESTHNQH